MAEGLSWQFHFAALQLMAYHKQIRFLRVPPELCIAVQQEHRGRPLSLRLVWALDAIPPPITPPFHFIEIFIATM